MAADESPLRSALGARLVRAATVVLVFASVAMFPAVDASAHAVFVAAFPAPGAALRTPPPAVRITFSEPLNASLSGIRLYTSSGRPVRHPARVETPDPRTYAIRIPPLRPDRYTVVWNTVSAIDGHTRRGSYTFTVDRPDGSPPRVSAAAGGGFRAPPQVPTSVQAAAKWGGLVGLFLMAGAVLLGALCGGPGPGGIRGLRPVLRPRLHLLALGGAVLVVLGTAGELISDWAAAGWSGSALASLLSSSAGRWQLARISATALLVLSRLPAGRSEPRWLDPARLAGIGVVALSFAATGHGAASPLPAPGLAFEFAHVFAAGLWLGGAIALAAVWSALRRQEPAPRRALLHRFSVVAGIAVPVVLATGLGNTVVELGSVNDLVRDSYGVSLLVKLLAVIVLLGIAAVNAVVLRPDVEAGRGRGRRLKVTVAVEAALGVAVLVPTAVLGVLAPSRPLDQARASAQAISATSDPAHEFTAATRLDGRDVELTVTPGAVGPNAIRLEVAGVFSAPDLRLSVTGPGDPVDAALARTGHDHDSGTHTIYQGALRLSRTGTWHALVRDGGSKAGAPVVLPVSAPVPGLPAPNDATDLLPWLLLIALGGAAAAAGAAARAVPRRRRTALLSLAGAGLAVSIAWAGNLAVASEDTAQPTGSTHWGVVHSAVPTQQRNAAVWHIPTPGAGLMTPAIAPDGSVWVPEMNANKLARLDPRRGEIQEFRFPGGYRETMGTAVDASGRVWLAQEHAMALGMFDPGAGRYHEYPIPGGVSAPVGIAVDSRGVVWFTEMSGNRIGRFDPRTLRFSSYRIPTPDATPYWLAVSPEGKIWFTEFRTGKIGVLTPRTGKIREYPVPGAHPNVPGIAVARDGSVWFTTTQGALFRFTPTSGRLHRVLLPTSGEYGVTVAPDGTVWVGCQGGRTVYAVEPAAGAVRAVRLPEGSAPWWPTVGRRGRVWVALAGDRGNGLALVRGSS